MVGSIELTVKQGDTLRRGDEVGYFAFGGCECATVRCVQRAADIVALLQPPFCSSCEFLLPPLVPTAR